MKRWEDLPIEMQIDEIRPYYDILQNKKFSLIGKRIFDVALSSILMAALSPVFAGLSIAIKLESPGPVFYRQERVTQYGRKFRIHKFRTMCDGADKIGSLVTVDNDSRITKVGKIIRKYRLDEISQLIDVLKGDMTFVGVRPEVSKYVDCYQKEWLATLLLPAGITNMTCIYYKDESNLLDDSLNPDEIYVKDILPGKMKWNLGELKSFSLICDLKTMIKTVHAVID